MQSRATLATVALLAALAVAGCTGGGDQPAPTTAPGSVPTAPPLASVPSPTIVTGAPNATGTPGAGGTPSPGGAGEQVHVVVAGDTISGLAVKYDVTTAGIRELNNLTSDDLQLGQRIRIPAKPAGGTTQTAPGGLTTYTVKEGDTAFGIALQFDTTVEALERANGVPAGGLDNLQLGQVVEAATAGPALTRANGPRGRLAGPRRK